MDIQLIRNATFVIKYGGKKFLIDPMFAPKEAYPPVHGSLNKTKWPLVDLPIPPQEIIKDTDVIIMTHWHLDHFDEYAINTLRKGVKVYMQDETDKSILRKEGFSNLTILPEEGTSFAGTRLYKTPCKHGIKDRVMPYFSMEDFRYEAMGVVMQNDEEKTIYITGDTIWCDEIKRVIDTYSPEYIIANCADAQFKESGSITMGIEDLQNLHTYAPEATIIAAHLDTVGHAMLDRKALKHFVKDNRLTDSILIPNDGELIKQ